MIRREFLKKSAAGALALPVGLQDAYGVAPLRHANGQQAPSPVLVVVYLRGGQDQLNTIVPYTDRTYYGIRPTLAIPKERVIKLDRQWGFHPALAALKPFYDEGRVAAVINSGSPHPTRSHFDAQDFMEYAAPGLRYIRDGWLNHYLQATSDQNAYDPNTLRALAMQELLPRSLRGDYPVVTVPANLNETEDVLDLFEDFYSSEDPAAATETIKKAAKIKARRKQDSGIRLDPVMKSGKETIQGVRKLLEVLYGEAEPTYSGRATDLGNNVFQEYPGTWFASRLKMLARAIRADVGLQVAATDINGWDHHIGLGSTDGTLNRMLTFLSESLAAFMQDLGPHLDRTLILVCTEFGRVARENGNDGSDHGHGGIMWLLGGRVKGGRIYGEWTGLESASLYQKRDLPVTTDFRDIFAEVLRGHMKFDMPSNFFPKYELPNEGLGLFA